MKFKNNQERFEQLEYCGYECEAGKMTMNVAYQELKDSVIKLEKVRDLLLEAHKRRGAVMTGVCGDNDAVVAAWDTLK